MAIVHEVKERGTWIAYEDSEKRDFYAHHRWRGVPIGSGELPALIIPPQASEIQFWAEGASVGISSGTLNLNLTGFDNNAYPLASATIATISAAPTIGHSYILPQSAIISWDSVS